MFIFKRNTETLSVNKEYSEYREVILLFLMFMFHYWQQQQQNPYSSDSSTL
jgi:hypothetical protein